MGFELSFGQVEAVLAKLNKIADHKRVAFMSRLKHLQKNGCPDRQKRPGRGKPGAYSFSELMQTAIAVDLLQSGLPPALAAKIATGTWLGIRATVYIATFLKADVDEINEARVRDGLEERDYPDTWLWMVSPEALRDMTTDGTSEWDHYEAMMPVRLSDAAEQLEKGSAVGVFGRGWRTLVINGTALTQAVMSIVAHHFRFAEWKAMRDDIKVEMDEDEARFEEFAEEIKKMPGFSPEKLAAIRERFGAIRETDFSTKPPSPPAMTIAQAKDIILHTDPDVLAPMGAADGIEIEISGEVFQRLLFLRLVEIVDDEEDPRAEFTVLGWAVHEFLRDPIMAKRKIGIDTTYLGFGRY